MKGGIEIFQFFSYLQHLQDIIDGELTKMYVKIKFYTGTTLCFFQVRFELKLRLKNSLRSQAECPKFKAVTFRKLPQHMGNPFILLFQCRLHC